MSTENPRKSLVEQIIEATFDTLETSEAYNSSNIQQLRELAKIDELRRYGRIINALKNDLGEENETS